MLLRQHCNHNVFDELNVLDDVRLDGKLAVIAKDQFHEENCIVNTNLRREQHAWLTREKQ
jgi:hypothetical protein